MKLVKIDRSSIQKNPKYGKGPHDIHEVGPVSIRLHMSFMTTAPHDVKSLDALFAKFDVRLTNLQMEFPGGLPVPKTHIQAMARTPEGASEVIELFKRLPDVTLIDHTVHIDRPLMSFYMIGQEPKWLYNHEDIRFECSGCGCKLKPEELTSDHSGDYDDEMDDSDWSHRVCPKCYKWDCCDNFDYEKIEDVIEEMGLDQ